MAEGRWFRSEASNGGTVQETLGRCIDSLLNQSALDSVVIHIVSHELPLMRFDEKLPVVLADKPAAQPAYQLSSAKGPEKLGVSSCIMLHFVDFPAPPDIDLATYNRLSGKVLDRLPDVRRRRVGDKYSKIKVGLSAALSDPESRWVMFVDSDDLVQRDVVAWVLSHDGETTGGYTVTKGYSWRVGESFLRKVNGFYGVCGTCNIVRFSDEEKKQFIETGDVNSFDRKTHWLFAGHSSVYRRLREAGRSTNKLPFRAAVYVTGTGFNYSGIKHTGHGNVPIDEQLKFQFGIK